MSFEGVWTAEVFGPHGWDSHGVLLLEDGRLAGGDNRQCTSGIYEVYGDGIEAELKVDYHGQPRTIFGEAAGTYSTRITGRLQGGIINGVLVRPDRPEFELQVRLVRRMQLPGRDRASSGKKAGMTSETGLDGTYHPGVLHRNARPH